MHALDSTPTAPRNRRILAAVGLLLLGVALPFSPPAGASSEISSRGTEFWFAFPTNETAASAQPRLFIASEQATQGTVVIAGTSTSLPFTVSAGGLVTLDLPPAVQVTATDGVAQDLGVRVVADDPVTVYGLNLQPFTTDAFLAIPSAALGTEYRVLAAPTSIASIPGGFTVVGTRDGTQVTITPSIDAGTRTAATPFTVSLDTGDAFQLTTDQTVNADLSGTLIEADSPVAVMGFVQCVNIPNSSVTACDHIVQQLPSVDNWGTTFAVPKLEPRARYTLRVAAARAGTEVRIDGELETTLAAGEIHTSAQSSDVLVTTSRPALVAQYAHGINDPADSGSGTGDPFMMLIPSTEQFLNAYTIATAGSNFTSHYVNVVTSTAGTSGITRGGVAVPSGDFTEIGGAGSGLWGATVAIGNGTHRFEGTEPFGIFTYGWTSADSYGYPGGTAFRSGVGTVTGISVAPTNTAVQVGTQLCITASLTGSAGADLSGVRVDWTVTGANASTAQITSDADGESEYCSTPGAAGSDTVTASAAGLSASATVLVTTGPPPAIGSAPSSDEVSGPVSVAVEQAAELEGTESVLVRGSVPVPVTTTVSRDAGPRGGLVIEDESKDLSVTVTTSAGVSETAGVVVPESGEVVCEICARLAAGSVVEAWVYSEPRLTAAVRVEVDAEEGTCPFLRIPTGTPLDGGGAIEAGVHTLQLRMYTENGFEVLAFPITVGGPVPSGVPSGEGPAVPGGLLAGVAGLAMAAGLAGLRRRSHAGAAGTVITD